MTTTRQINRCLCGCGSATFSRFASGHDARLKGQLVDKARRGHRKANLQLRALGWDRHLAQEFHTLFVNRDSKGRFARTNHVQANGIDFDGFWTADDISHSHPACPDAASVTVNESSASGWLCTTCIHTNPRQVWA